MQNKPIKRVQYSDAICVLDSSRDPNTGLAAYSSNTCNNLVGLAAMSFHYVHYFRAGYKIVI